MKPFEKSVSSQYGAPMGRRSVAVSGLVTLCKVRMVDGDYDSGGAYWGGGSGVEPLWCAYNDEGAQYLRARDRKAAMALLPDCTFVDPNAPSEEASGPPTQAFLERFVDGFLECALWSSTDTDDSGECIELDKDHTAEDFAEPTFTALVRQCESFVKENWTDLADESPEHCGHDFWLTRCGHGAGFWDGDYPKAKGDRLTKASKMYGNVDLYTGDDGQIYAGGMER